MDVLSSVRVVRHTRARNLRLKLDIASGEVILTLPPRASLTQARAFVQKQQAWIAAAQQRVAPALALTPETVLPLFGTDTQLGTLVKRAGDPALFQPRLIRALKKLALAQFTAWGEAFATQLGVTLPRIAVKDTQSRWGSCSRRSGLALSWRLVFAPSEVARYVVAHEVAHLREMNHSPAFWALVTALVGEAKPARRWLAAEGGRLLRLGVATAPQPPVNTSFFVPSAVEAL